MPDALAVARGQSGGFIVRSLEADDQFVAMFQHRPFDHAGIFHHDHHCGIVADIFLHHVGQLAKGRAALVDQRFPADLQLRAFLMVSQLEIPYILVSLLIALVLFVLRFHPETDVSDRASVTFRAPGSADSLPELN